MPPCKPRPSRIKTCPENIEMSDRHQTVPDAFLLRTIVISNLAFLPLTDPLARAKNGVNTRGCPSGSLRDRRQRHSPYLSSSNTHTPRGLKWGRGPWRVCDLRSGTGTGIYVPALAGTLQLTEGGGSGGGGARTTFSGSPTWIAPLPSLLGHLQCGAKLGSKQ